MREGNHHLTALHKVASLLKAAEEDLDISQWPSEVRHLVANAEHDKLSKDKRGMKVAVDKLRAKCAPAVISCHILKSNLTQVQEQKVQALLFGVYFTSLPVLSFS